MLCRGCSASLCLGCGTVDVTKDHFYGQVQFNDLKNICVCRHSTHLRDIGLKMLEMPCGKLWIKTLGRGGGDWVERWSLGNNLVHFFEILYNFMN